MKMVIIRDYREADAVSLRQCVVVLQDHEQMIEPQLRSGEEMADQYCLELHARCRKSGGRVFVAEEDGVIIGFVAVLSRESFTELDEPPGEYAVVTDLVVLEPFRGRGIGRQLLQRAEAFVREVCTNELRIGVRSKNEAARRLYFEEGFIPHFEILAKR
jgi:GNAT superfamily N-acetyltransferase